MTTADYQTRVTVDLDGDKHTVRGFETVALRAYHNLADIADAVDVAVSSGGEGLHLIGWFSEDLQFADQVAVRRQCHDDPRRVDMGIQRWLEGLYTDVLFEEKHGRERTQTRYATIYDALDTIRVNRTDDAEQMQRLVKHGHKAAPDLSPRARRADQ